MKKIAIMLLLCFISANTKEIYELDEIEITGGGIGNSQKIGVHTKTAKDLEKAQISDSRDLVRHETGINVVESGRFGVSGYAIRGVDENRVAIQVDGLHQAETLSSQGFKDVFEGYGNYNNTRNGVEMEHIGSIRIAKGADSIKSGSGALGGSVIFETKDARDYLTDKNFYFGIKQGYSSKDEQIFASATLAFRYKYFDLLFINTARIGKEIKNYGYDSYDDSIWGKTRQKADPYSISRDSNLIKFSFQPSDEHRFSVVRDYSTLKSQGSDFSYTLQRTTTPPYVYDYGKRYTDDASSRKNYSFAYENQSENFLWDFMKITYSNQKIKNKARTDEYCKGDKCLHKSNPSGIRYKLVGDTYKAIDKYGGELKVSGQDLLDSKGNKVSYRNLAQTEANFIDCDKMDCSKKIQLIEEGFYDTKIVTKQIQTKKSKNGKIYGYINSSDYRYIVPQQIGAALSDYSDRDLKTDINQINFDFEKEFTLFDTEHFLAYGGLKSLTQKTMINQVGREAKDLQWWAQNFTGGKKNPDWTYTPDESLLPFSGSEKRHTIGLRDTYLIPVKTNAYAFYFTDEINLFDNLSLDLAYRYDNIKHTPHFDKNTPIPKGLILGLEEPIPADCDLLAPNAYNSECVNKNFRTNLKYLQKTSKYSSDSYSFGINLQAFDWLKLQGKYSKAFRAPTSDEVYLTFKHPNFSIAPNTKLKAETAKTQEFALSFHNDKSFATFSVFRTNYENFIDLAYEKNRIVELGSSLPPYPYYKSINRTNARVDGFEVNSLLNLGDLFSKIQGFKIGWKFTYQKGKIKGEDGTMIPMNAISPPTSVINLGYFSPNQKYGVDLFVKSVAKKKAKDTYNMWWKGQKKEGKLVKGAKVINSEIAWRSGGYTILDLLAYAKPIKNLSFGFGIYNLLDKKYMTWDMARQIRAVGTMNMIDQNTGAGIERFLAPGRNFKINMEMKF